MDANFGSCAPGWLTTDRRRAVAGGGGAVADAGTEFALGYAGVAAARKMIPGPADEWGGPPNDVGRG